MARQCHIQSLYLSKQAVPKPDRVVIGDILAIKHDDFMIMLDGLDPKEDYPKSKSIKQTEEIQINRKCQTTRIGMLFNEDQKREMKRFLRNNFDIFAWSTAEIPGISPITIYHSFNVNPAVQPIKQKKRKFALERVKAIKQETKKLLKDDFI